MESPERTKPTEGPASAPERSSADEATGLPGLKTWRAVYILVLASFVLWVGLLVALGMIFR
jgi:hypothetical protein